MRLHRGFRDVHLARDHLVRLALDGQLQGLGLALGQAVQALGRSGSGRRFAAGLGQRMRRQVGAAGQHQPQRGHHHRVGRGLRDEAAGASVDDLADQCWVFLAGEHDDHRILQLLAQQPQHLQPAEAGQVEVQQHDVEVLAGGQRKRLVGVRRLGKHDRVGQVAEQQLDPGPEQFVIVNQQDVQNAPASSLGRYCPGDAEDLPAG